MRVLLPAAFAACLLGPPGAFATGLFENPSENTATVSGVSLVSGWHCSATRVEIEFDGSIRVPAPLGSDRLDTASVCGGKRDTGFGLLFNWGVLAPGTHTVRALADGVEFGRRTVTVVDLGGQFLTGKSATAIVSDFPSEGRQLLLEWREGLQSFVAREVRAAPSITGRWNGANLERRSNCASSANNGTRGTYAQWDATLDTVGDTLRILETGITGLSCTYVGSYRIAGNTFEWFDGTYTCTDGKTGTFRSTEFLVTARAFSIRLATKLTGTETCDIDAILGGSRF